MASNYYKWHHGKVHYQRKGVGDPLVLIHNIYPGASHEEWEQNIDSLARHFTVHAVDLLGFGDSDAPKIKYTAATYVELIFDFLREVALKPAVVVSSGLSCAYVSEVAAWRANLLDRMVFVCPRSEPVGMDSPRWLAAIRRFLLNTSALGGGYYDTMVGETELEIYLRQCFCNPRSVTRAKIQRLMKNAQLEGSVHAYSSLVTGYLDSSILKWLPKAGVPLLLIWGKEAKPTPVEHSVRLVALAQQCRLEVVGNAGSWVHDEQSAQVNQLIVDYARSPLPAAHQRPA